ncbi:MAG: hypothetical protein A2V45_15610 [Candidatus Aminicenantes bacterium RBG_19FT_COMBO_58_17]|nr:MAG: hypothetical protein A2V45_15610 [Candidatus Aminicenantes bacterium RBG_19FT_COMBO_58_17]
MTITKSAALKLLAYCRANDWSGYDPYDALNSRVFKALPFLNFKLARLALTQGVKRCPVNLRPMLLVPKTPNPKGIALFLSSLVRLSKSGMVDGGEYVRPLADKLLALRSPGRPRSCWGYNFDWQQRFELVPKGSPNIICTTFAANALLDAHQWTPEPLWPETAVSAAEFILKDLFWREGGDKACFRYTLVGRGKVHNANLLGAAFLCRVGRVSGDRKYSEPALDAARFSVDKQHPDGSWAYGEAPTQQWIDNFHTGFNLVALRCIQEYAGTTEFDPAIRKGFEFFKAHFFRKDGAPKYFHDAVYPIDIHTAAQSIVTLTEFADFGADNLKLADAVLDWALENMRNKRGYFYFQKRPLFTVKTSFMRWSQAWMLLALASLLNERKLAS